MLAVLCALLLAPPAAGPWHLVGPGGGGWIQSCAYSPHQPQTLYLGCDVGGFYRSDDGGTSWRILNRGLRDPFVQAIVAHPTQPAVLWVATLSGVHRSDDGGESWRLQRTGWPASERHKYVAPIGCLVLDPRHADTLYAGLGNPRERRWGQGTIMVTRDGGEHWARLNPTGALPADAVVSDLLVRPDGFLAATQHGLFRSGDGQTWTKVGGGLPAARTRYLASPASRPEVLYCTVEASAGQQPWDGGIWRSDDGGQTWRPVVEGLPHWLQAGKSERNLTSQYDRIVVDPANADRVFVGGSAWVNAGMYGSTDGGQHWTALIRRDRAKPPVNFDQGYIGWGPSPECLALHPANPQRLLFGTSGSVIETLDGGASWQQRHTRRGPDDSWSGTGAEVTCLWTIAPHPTRADDWLLGYMDIAVWRTTDAGHWLSRAMTGVKRDHDSTGQAFAWDPELPDQVWAGIGQWGNNKGGLYFSRDSGRSWTPVPGLPDAQVKTVRLDPTSPGGARRLAVALQGQGVFCGPADGSRWVQQADSLPSQVLDLAWQGGPQPGWLAVVDGPKGAPGSLWRKTGDADWARLDSPPLTGSPRSLVVAPSDPRRLYVAARERWIEPKLWPGGLFGSRDGGQTWRHLFTDRFVAAVAVDPRNADHVVLGCTDHPYHDEPLGSGVRESFDGGVTWTDITANLPLPNITCLAFDAGGRLLAGTGGVSLWWRAAGPEVTRK